MPIYFVHGGWMHMKISGKAAPQCVARVERGGRETKCCGISGFACDWPVGDSTCSAPLCADHAHQVGRNEHYCPRHFAEHSAKTPGLFDAV